MRFWNSSNNDDGNPATGNIIVRAEIASRYSDIWERIIEAGTDEQSAYVPVGGTPLAASLVEAKTYFDNQKLERFCQGVQEEVCHSHHRRCGHVGLQWKRLCRPPRR